MRRWLIALVLICAAAFSFTVMEGIHEPKERRSAAVAFASMTGGLGMGASRALYWDFSTFDPRLEPDCTCSLWPVPGGFLFSPEHRLTVWDPPEMLGPLVAPPQGGRMEAP